MSKRQATKKEQTIEELLKQLQVSEQARRQAEQARQEMEDTLQETQDALQELQDGIEVNNQLLFTHGLPVINSQQLQTTKPSISASDVRLRSTDSVTIVQKPFGVFLPSECRRSNYYSTIWKEKNDQEETFYNSEASIQSYIETVLKDLSCILRQHAPIDAARISIFREQTIFSLRPDLSLTRQPDSSPIGFVEVKLPQREHGLPPPSSSSLTHTLNHTIVVEDSDEDMEDNADEEDQEDEEQDDIEISSSLPERRVLRPRPTPSASSENSSSSSNLKTRVKIKDPMSDDFVMRQVRDYLMYLRNEHGVRFAFCILSTYDYWRVVWIPDESSDNESRDVSTLSSSPDQTTTEMTRFAELSNVDLPKGSSNKEAKRTKSNATADAAADEWTALLERASSAQGRVDFIRLRQSGPLLDKPHQQLNKHQQSNKPRQIILHASRIYRYDEPEVTLILMSAMYKMWSSPTHPIRRIVHPDRQYLMMSRDGPTISWVSIPSTLTHLKWMVLPTPQTKHFYILKRLGTGAHGTAFLACSNSGAVCVLKFASAELMDEHRKSQGDKKKKALKKSKKDDGIDGKGSVPAKAQSSSSSSSSSSLLSATHDDDDEKSHVFDEEAGRWRELWGHATVRLASGQQLQVVTNANFVWTTVIGRRPCLIMPFVWTYRSDSDGDEHQPILDRTNWNGLPARASDVFFTPRHASITVHHHHDYRNVNAIDQNASSTVNESTLASTMNEHRAMNREAAQHGSVASGFQLSSSKLVNQWGIKRPSSLAVEEEESIFDSNMTAELLRKEYAVQAALACRLMSDKNQVHADPHPRHVGLLPVVYATSSSLLLLSSKKNKKKKKTLYTGNQSNITFAPVMIDLTQTRSITKTSEKLEAQKELEQSLHLASGSIAQPELASLSFIHSTTR